MSKSANLLIMRYNISYVSSPIFSHPLHSFEKTNVFVNDYENREPDDTVNIIFNPDNFDDINAVLSLNLSEMSAMTRCSDEAKIFISNLGVHQAYIEYRKEQIKIANSDKLTLISAPSLIEYFVKHGDSYTLNWLNNMRHKHPKIIEIPKDIYKISIMYDNVMFLDKVPLAFSDLELEYDFNILQEALNRGAKLCVQYMFQNLSNNNPLGGNRIKDNIHNSKIDITEIINSAETLNVLYQLEEYYKNDEFKKHNINLYQSSVHLFSVPALYGRVSIMNWLKKRIMSGFITKVDYTGKNLSGELSIKYDIFIQNIMLHRFDDALYMKNLRWWMDEFNNYFSDSWLCIDGVTLSINLDEILVHSGSTNPNIYTYWCNIINNISHNNHLNHQVFNAVISQQEWALANQKNIN